MKIGLAGLGGSGKTTIFAALTGQAVEVGPGGRYKTHLGTVKVADERVDKLSALFSPKKTTYAEIVFADVAGEPKEGKGYFDPARTAALREMDALVQVVRGFIDAEGRASDPAADVRSFATEMILQDLILVENRLERLKKEKPRASREPEALAALRAHLEAERPVRSAGLSAEDAALFQGFRFLSDKPLLVVLNVAEADAARPAPADAVAAAREAGAPLVCLSGTIEAEIARLEPADQREFLASVGLPEPALARFVTAAFAAADLIVFLTSGEDECRAWPIRRGTSARRAAGKIHSDLEKGFIRAEVMRWEDLVALGSEARVREAGKLRLEGKDYVVQDGDVMHVRFAGG